MSESLPALGYKVSQGDTLANIAWGHTLGAVDLLLPHGGIEQGHDVATHLAPLQIGDNKASIS